MDGATFNAYYTLLVFAVIIIVIIWAYSGRNKAKFDHDANSIFEEDKQVKGKDQDQKRESKSDE
ncbi:cbb3-type cytochrome oxidase subunit 3 [Aliidiomarina maris]|uniref:CcoQ/FixQ family Cbb3-type cytochrome c oxidase assembly chaperone n=1 Tax=Aliidiomarina maris TaxID=531312 RepID=A0A327WZN8_9GAMM|nr:CcoQ/FixQ family Cbb3-type cytochrome c oxidase assembly chaperone [Aliidiomarina maris]MBA3989358.1 CcoQ/FixQ family Cbb3-type cytochrome c oxidase assembly chaperone [Idiomarina sp.]MCL4410151.1 CcoQ/FixQ family Cbb3-type cytochrome c oxidase assembly chaperone [Gammaproteobacteria bacterium]RAJ98919.1 cytochrome c oxidase cbb3-type subunit 4 [Aliidiomarina maris]RUO25062.1 CcoQ/FixQ family Cbb3-type cytochrome c oxidase assembly chaperone [Aliidiomarina maris]